MVKFAPTPIEEINVFTASLNCWLLIDLFNPVKNCYFFFANKPVWTGERERDKGAIYSFKMSFNYTPTVFLWPGDRLCGADRCPPACLSSGMSVVFQFGADLLAIFAQNDNEVAPVEIIDSRTAVSL